MEKIALIMGESARNLVISPRSIKRMESLGEVVLGEGSDRESVKKAIAGATIAITTWGNTQLDADILSVCPDLKLVCHAAGSVKPIVCDDLWNKGVRVTASAAMLSMGVSETALGFTIAASKNFFALNENLHNGGWAEGKENIRELYELNIGVIGGGWAGRHYIELMQAFDVDIFLYDPFVTEEQCEKMGCKKASLEEVLKESDIISIHAPSIPETNNMFNAETLALMKKDAVLINTARGSIIDEKALYEHMKAGNLKYACLDVFEPEPPAADHPLRSLPNVIMTPHLAGLAANGLKKIGKHCCEEIERFLNGEKMMCEVTKEQLARMA